MICHVQYVLPGENFLEKSLSFSLNYNNNWMKISEARTFAFGRVYMSTIPSREDDRKLCQNLVWETRTALSSFRRLLLKPILRLYVTEYLKKVRQSELLFYWRKSRGSPGNWFDKNISTELDRLPGCGCSLCPCSTWFLSLPSGNFSFS